MGPDGDRSNLHRIRAMSLSGTVRHSPRLPDTLGLTCLPLPPPFVFFSPFFLRYTSYLLCVQCANARTVLGCPCARLCPHRGEEGEEGRTTEEGSGEEGQGRLRVKGRSVVVVSPSPSSCILRFPFASHPCTHPCTCPRDQYMCPRSCFTHILISSVTTSYCCIWW